jgi:hypothetical protein
MDPPIEVSLKDLSFGLLPLKWLRWLKMLVVKPPKNDILMVSNDIFKVRVLMVYKTSIIELEDFTPIFTPNDIIKNFENVLNENKELLKREYKKEYKPLLYGVKDGVIIALLLVKDLEDNRYYLESRVIELFIRNIERLKEDYIKR